MKFMFLKSFKLRSVFNFLDEGWALDKKIDMGYTKYDIQNPIYNYYEGNMKINMEVVEHVKISEKIYRILKKAILDGDLKPGQKLNQGELAEALKVSRTPVREALLKLGEERLVKDLPYKGTIVYTFSSKEIKECFEIRGILEGYAVRIATENIAKTELNKLVKLTEEMELHKNNLKKVTILNDKFHKVICKASKNDRLYYVIEDMLKNFPRDISWSLPGRVENSVKEHKQILDAMRKEEGKLAEELMIKHLHSVANSVIISYKNKIKGGN